MQMGIIHYCRFTDLHHASPLSGNRCGLVVGGPVVEVHVGPLHVVDLQQPLQRSLCAHRYRGRHCAVWTVWLLRHLQGAPLDAENGGSFCWCLSLTLFFLWILSRALVVSVT